MPNSKRKTKFTFPWLKSLAVIVGLLLLGAVGVAIWGYYGRHWQESGRFTIIKFDPVEVHSFDPINNQGVILQLPSQLEISSIGGRGAWRAEVIAQAGKPDWAAASVANYLGIAALGDLRTLSWWDRWQWDMRSKGVSWQVINLGESRFVEEHVLPDGIKVFRLASNWDNQARVWFTEQAIAEQSLGVVIVNTWAHPGLGTSASRVVESMGFKVRNLTTSEEKLDQCVVQSPLNLKKSLPVRRLMETFDCSWEETMDADLHLVLGRDYIRWRWGE